MEYGFHAGYQMDWTFIPRYNTSFFSNSHLENATNYIPPTSQSIELGYLVNYVVQDWRDERNKNTFN